MPVSIRKPAEPLRLPQSYVVRPEKPIGVDGRASEQRVGDASHYTDVLTVAS